MKRVTLHSNHLSEYVSEQEISRRTAKFAHLLEEARQAFPDCRPDVGWFCPDVTASEDVLRRIEEKAEQIRRQKAVFVLIGVGGSNNAARAVVESLMLPKQVEVVYAGNSTAPSAIRDVYRRMEGREVYLNIIAKNFETLEPGSVFKLLRGYLYERYGREAASHIIATGTPGSQLEQLCRTHGWDFFAFPKDVGGRYSAITNVGLLPMAVAGVNIRELVAGALEMKQELLSADADRNDALRYAAVRSILYEKGYRVELLTHFEPRMRWFAKWWIQMYGESEGKQGKGLVPASCEYSEELHSMGQFLQEGTPTVIETFLNMQEPDPGPVFVDDGIRDGFAYLHGKHFAELNNAAFEAAMEAHSAHVPCLEIRTADFGERTFGAMFFFFMLSCVFSCRMINVNPFDQPSVEAYKKRMFSALGKPGI